MQECPQPPPEPASHAGRARTGAPTDRSRGLGIGRAVRRSRPGQSVDHRPCLPVFFSWLHFRQPRRQQPHVAAHSSDHRIGPGSQTPGTPPVRRSRHPLRPHSAQSGSAGHRWPAARHASWLTLITSSGRHIMRRSVREAPSAASMRPPRRTAVILSPFGISPGHKGILRLRHVADVKFWVRLRTEKRSDERIDAGHVRGIASGASLTPLKITRPRRNSKGPAAAGNVCPHRRCATPLSRTLNRGLRSVAVGREPEQRQALCQSCDCDGCPVGSLPSVACQAQAAGCGDLAVRG